jgi:hypothetical protein
MWKAFILVLGLLLAGCVATWPTEHLEPRHGGREGASDT